MFVSRKIENVAFAFAQRPRSDTIRAGLRHSELGSFQGLRSVVNPGAGAMLQSFPGGLMG